MKSQWNAIYAELLKNRHTSALWATFIAFSIAPLMGGVFMLIMRNPEALSKAGGLSAKIKMMNMAPDWFSYMGILTQAVGVGGVMIFGFVASWVFGREYSEGTAKDLLALPISRTRILNAKFAIYTLWCFGLVISNLLVGFIVCLSLQLVPTTPEAAFSLLRDYAMTTVLTVPLGTSIAFFALWGKGYLAPLGFVALTLVFAQVIAATGYGTYFPWSIPGLFSGAGGEYKALLTPASYGILFSTSFFGYVATLLYWKHADQSI